MSVNKNQSARLIRAVRSAVTVGAMLAALGGCYSYRPDRVANPVTMPPAWDFQDNAATAVPVQPEWWTAFGSPVLNDLIAQALRDNPGIIATEERLKQAERAFSQGRDALFPEIRLSGSTSVGSSGGTGLAQATDERTANLSLSAGYDVDLWGGAAARFRAQVAQFVGTQYDADLAHTELAAQVARAYFSLLSIRSRVNIARENLAIAEEVLRIQRVRYENDVLRQFDLTQQTTQVLTQRTQLIPLENSMRQAETALGLLLGRTPQEFRIEGEPIDQLQVPEIAPWVPSELLLRRPDMAAAETDMWAANANLSAARAALIPVTVQLSATGNQIGDNTALFSLTDARTFSLQGVLSIAEGIFSFRQKRNAVLNAESNEYITLINYAQTIRTALKEVDDTLATANANLRTEEALRETLANTRRALELAQVELREGSGSQQDLLDAQRSLFTAEDSLAQSRLTRLNTAVQLYQALGGGWTHPDP
ncbi:MAG: efflux transporter outer membrane subunit [Nevskiaceae bacterium]|nr:efflux transporter outer membrane subunit [Nevskiaceae bacterium]